MTNFPTSAADDLGLLQAQIADLKVKEKELKDVLISTGEDRIDGELYAVTVSRVDAGTRFDAKLARSYLTDEQIAACMAPTAPQTRVTVRARK